MYTADDFEKAIGQLANAGQESAEAFSRFFRAYGETVSMGIQAGIRMVQRKNTNNWRKMHGLPMRRRGGRR